MNNTPMKLITQLSSWYYIKFCNCPKYYKYVVIKIKINYGKQWQDFCFSKMSTYRPDSKATPWHSKIKLP